MRKTQRSEKSKTPPTETFGRGDLMRLGVRPALLIVVGGGWGYSPRKARNAPGGGDEKKRAEIEFTEKLYVPPFDFSELAQRVDTTTQGRRLIDEAVLGEVLDYTSLLTETQYDAMGASELDAEVAAELLAAPAASCGRPLRVRGRITRLFPRRPKDSRPWHEGTLVTEDETAVSFATRTVDDDPDTGLPLGEGDFVRVDGVFLKSYQPDEAITPLVVGSTVMRSYESVGSVTSIPDDIIRAISSDSLETGATATSPRAKWVFLAYARDLEPEDFDWDAAPELDNARLAELYHEPDQHVGKPFRIPVSKNMGTWRQSIPENPARLGQITTGWIGNTTWAAGNGLIRFDTAVAPLDLVDGDYVTARGFFVRNQMYEPAKGGVAIAPYFVLAELDRFVPTKDPFIGYLFIFVAAMTLGLLVLFFVLLTRDRKKSEALQRKLVERRRARQARA